MFFEIESLFRPATLLERESNTDVFLLNMGNLQNTSGGCFCTFQFQIIGGLLIKSGGEGPTDDLNINKPVEGSK